MLTSIHSGMCFHYYRAIDWYIIFVEWNDSFQSFLSYNFKGNNWVMSPRIKSNIFG